MATEVRLPEMGEGIKAGNVLKVLVNPGDKVSDGQGIAEIETDKALVEIPSPSAGVVESVQIKAGQSVEIGAVLVTLSGGAKDAAAAPVPADGPAAQPQTDTASTAPTQDQAHTARSAAAEEASPRSNGSIEAEAASPFNSGVPKPRVGLTGPSAESNGEVAASPSTRRLARSFGVSLETVRGSGRGGRVTQDDLIAFVQQNSGAASSGGVSALPPLPDFSKWGDIERVPMSMVRAKTAEHMALAWSVIPHVTQFERADITALEALRKRQSAAVEASGHKLTVTTFALKAVAAALKAQPEFNCSVDMAGKQVIRKSYISIGIAVDTERGLLVPVLRDVDKKDVLALTAELADLSDRARSGKLDISEMQGGTFTISNQGGIGGAEFTPIVNWPEVAILAIGRSRLEPVVVGDKVLPRLMMPLAVSYDHRVIDGAKAAAFIRRLKESFEDPERLLMGL